MIEIKNLTKKYDFTVLDDIDLILPDTGFICITGESGSGKTTLLNIIGMNISADGEVLYNGENLLYLKGRKKDSFRSKIFSYIEQNVTFLENMSVSDNIKLMTYSDVNIDDMLRAFNMILLGDSVVKNLSGGERERVALMMAYLRNTPVILSDEPTANLDEDNAIVVMETLKKLSEDRLVIISSHMRELAKRYADRTYSIESAKVSHIDINGKESLPQGGQAKKSSDKVDRSSIGSNAKNDVEKNRIKNKFTIKETFRSFVKCVNKNMSLALSIAIITLLSFMLLLGGFIFLMNPVNDMTVKNMEKAGVRSYFTFDKAEGVFFGNKNSAGSINEHYVDTEKMFANDIESGRFKGRLPQKFGEYVISDYFEDVLFEGDAIGRSIERGDFASEVDIYVCGVYRTGLLGHTTEKFDINGMKDIERDIVFTVYSDIAYKNERAELGSCSEIYVADDINSDEIIAGRIPLDEGEYVVTADLVAYLLSTDEQKITRDDVIYHPADYLGKFGASHKITKHGMYSFDIRVVGITDRIVSDYGNRYYISDIPYLDAFIDGYVAPIEHIDFQKEYLERGYSLSPYADCVDVLNVTSRIMVALGVCLFLTSLIIGVLLILSVKEENGKFLRTVYLLGFTRGTVAKSIFGYITFVIVLTLVISLIAGLILLSLFSNTIVAGTDITFLAYTITLSPIFIVIGSASLIALLVIMGSFMAVNSIIGGTYDRH